MARLPAAQRMGVGQRLYELRKAKGLSQVALGKQLAIRNTCISRAENGHSTPSLALLERWARALDAQLHQVFFVGDGKPEAPKVPEQIRLGAQERSLLGLFRQMPSRGRSLLLSLARRMVAVSGKAE